MSLLVKEIDGRRFRLDNKLYLTKYTLVQITNITDEANPYTFYVYKSSSEINVIRFLLNPERHATFWKGRNYITTTFLHLDLQQFIKSSFDRLPVSDETKYRSVETELLKTEIDNDNRLYDSDFWQELKHCDASSCFAPGSNPIARLYTTSSPEIKQLITETLDAEKKKNHSKEIVDFLTEALNENYDKNRENNLNQYKFYDVDVKVLRFRAQVVFEVMSKWMEKRFTVTGENLTELDAYTYNMGRQTVTGQFFTVEITCKYNGSKYLLVVNKYSLNPLTNFVDPWKPPPPHHHGGGNYEYQCIVNIIPQDNSITRHGLYSKYVDTGALLYKPFEYRDQFALMDPVVQTHDYNFIGDLIKDIFPLNNLPHILPKSSCSVCNQRYKQKYKTLYQTNMIPRE